MAVAAALLAGCTVGTFSFGDMFGSGSSSTAPAQPAGRIGTGEIKAALILPLSASGNAAFAAQSMRNAAEMALAEFQAPNVQLIVKDDGGSAQGAQRAAQEALEEGAEIILGPMFSHSVGPAAQVARARGVPIIAFSTDVNVASRGVYLLSFLPESDVERIVQYAVGNGKRSFAALVPESAYGSVVEAAFKQAVARRGARIIALERYAQDANAMQTTARTVAQAGSRADAIFIPDGAEAVSAIVQALSASGMRGVQLMGTGLWDDSRIFADAALQGGWYAGADPNGFRSFTTRYRSRYNQDPARTATLAYDAVALVAALVKTQGAQRFSEEVLTNSSGFAGVDGLFRFRSDGTNQRGLAVLRVAPNGGQVVAPPPRAFGASGT